MYEKARAHKPDRISNLDCIHNYDTSIQSNRRKVVLFAADVKMLLPNTTADRTTSELYGLNRFSASDVSLSNDVVKAYDWICSSDPQLANKTCSDDPKHTPDTWKVSYISDNLTSYLVDYCLSKKAEPRCKVQLTLPIAILVTVLSLFKAALTLYTALENSEDPLITMGDAVATFLEKRDETTKGMYIGA